MGDTNGRAARAASRWFVMGAAVAALAILAVAYFLGRRGGKKRTTLVEIRRL